MEISFLRLASWARKQRGESPFDSPAHTAQKTTGTMGQTMDSWGKIVSAVDKPVKSAGTFKSQGKHDPAWTRYASTAARTPWISAKSGRLVGRSAIIRSSKLNSGTITSSGGAE